MKSVKRRQHAARVALVATAIVAVAFLLCMVGLGEYVDHRLVGEADTRLVQQLAEVVPGPLGHRPKPHDGGDHDTDNAIIYLWKVAANGSVSAVTDGAPNLPRRAWTTEPVSLTLGSTPFRFDAVRDGTSTVVAGQSIATVGRVNDALLLPEFAFGLLLVIVTFVGSFVVGLRASAPLEQVRRRQAEFTADASHELRTPLSVVESEVDLALRRQRTPGEYEDVLHRIAAEGRRLRRIVEDLLWLARADAGPGEAAQVERADVGEIAGTCIDRFQALATQRSVGLELAREGTWSATVLAAPEWIDRLAGVLIDNACKYAGEGGRVVVGVASTQNRVVLRVDDSGPGIPPEERHAVFDRFHRATTDSGGAGLGLAIADSVVRMTGADWTVGNAPLGGARLSVSWRRAELRHDGRTGEGASSSVTGSAPRPPAPEKRETGVPK